MMPSRFDSDQGPAELVLEGRDGWLFLRNDRNDVIGQHEGRVRLGQTGLEGWKSLLERWLALQREFGYVWACEIAPDKEAVYAKYLPGSVELAPTRPVHEVVELGRVLGAEVNYMLDDLLAAKGEIELYSRTDTHWNQLGAFAGYRSICQRLAQRGVAVPAVEYRQIEWEGERGSGDLGSKLTPRRAGQLIRATIPGGSGRLVADNRIRHHGRVVIFERDCPELPSCVVFGESFTYYLFTFLKESFRRLVFVHTSGVIREVVAAERPEVVLSLPVERFLINPLAGVVDLGGLEETIRRKVAAGEIHESDDQFVRDIPKAGGCATSLSVGEVPWPSDPSTPAKATP